MHARDGGDILLVQLTRQPDLFNDPFLELLLFVVLNRQTKTASLLSMVVRRIQFSRSGVVVRGMRASREIFLPTKCLMN